MSRYIDGAARAPYSKVTPLSVSYALIAYHGTTMRLQISRRTFLKGAGVALAGTAIGGVIALGSDLQPKVAHAQEARIRQAKAYPSVCPYCAVGCGTLVHATGEGKDRTIINIEGNPESPVNYGNLCP